jgi:hypothetical protein
MNHPNAALADKLSQLRKWSQLPAYLGPIVRTVDLAYSAVVGTWGIDN